MAKDRFPIDRRDFIRTAVATLGALGAPASLRARPVVSARWTEADLRALAASTGVEVTWDAAARAAAEDDYGHLSPGRAAGVAQLTTARDVDRVVSFAAERDLPVTVRGTGHGQSGQSVAYDSLSLEVSRMRAVERPELGGSGTEPPSIVCEAGATWRDVLAVCSPLGLRPPSMPLLLDLSIGGTLSAGGVGPDAPRFGMAAANVRALEVVTGDGVRKWCSESDDPARFDAARGGLGRCGVITRARLILRRAPAQVRTFYLVYDAIESWVADQRRLVGEKRAEALDAFCIAGVQGMRRTPSGRRPFATWTYGLHVSIEHNANDAPSAEQALAGLTPSRVVHVEDDEARAFPSRFDARFESMRRLGAFAQPHPIFESFIPAAAVSTLVPRLLDRLPLFLGDGQRVLPIAPTGLPRGIAVPNGEFSCFAVLLTGVHPALLGDALAAMRDVDAMCRDAGGTRYLSGWLGDMDESRWKAHFGDKYAGWVDAKRRFDPRGIFVSRLFPPPA
jgi:cytokinin dehydrogenase